MKILFLTLNLLLPALAGASWFQTPDQQAFSAFQQQRYDEAAQLFQDSYQQGVALYRAGKYTEAERAFAQVTRPEKQADAQYNLGNAYFQQKQYDKAVQAYQNAVQAGNNDPDMLHNLQLAKKRVQKQQQNQQDKSENRKDSENQKDAGKHSSNQSPSQQTGSQKGEQNADATKSSSAKQSDSSQQRQPSHSQKEGQNEPSSTEPQQSANNSNKMPENQPNAENQPASLPQANSSPQSDEKQSAQQARSKSDKSATPNNGQAVEGNMEQIQKDMLADAWLNQIEENSEQLLKNQFKIDQWLAEQKRIATPTQDW